MANRTTQPSTIKMADGNNPKNGRLGMDKQLFADIYNTHQKELTQLALSYTKDLELSKDIVQEVFLDYWNRREEIEINYSIKFFLRKAIVNQCLMEIKKRKKLFNTADFEGLVNPEPTPISKMELNELKNLLLQIIDSMPKRRREVFMLSRISLLTHEEISMRLGISKKTIEHHITEALKTIRKALEDR